MNEEFYKGLAPHVDSQDVNEDILSKVSALSRIAGSPTASIEGFAVTANNGGGEGCIPNTNFIQWIVIDTGAGQGKANIQVVVPRAVNKIILLNNLHAAAQCFIHLDPLPDSTVVGGVLMETGTEQWFDLTNISAIRFRKPITRFYITHGDYGTGTILKLAATDDVEYYSREIHS